MGDPGTSNRRDSAGKGNRKAARTRKIKLLIVSRVQLHRDGLESLLADSPELDVIGSVGTHGEAEKQVANCEVVLYDVAGEEASFGLAGIARGYPSRRVLALGISGLGCEIASLAEAGVAGYLSADATPPELVEAIKGLVRGENPCSPDAVKALLEALGDRTGQGHSSDGHHRITPQPLTDRENAVLKLIARGLSNKEIGHLLHIEVTTVKNHVHSILQKLNLHRRAHAASWLRHQSPESAQHEHVSKHSGQPQI